MGITSNDIAAQRAMLARGEEKRKAVRQAEERERLRDTFAAAALTGYTTNPAWDDVAASIVAEQAYADADAMLRERSRAGQSAADTPPQSRAGTNHDAVPEARAESDEVRTDKAATSHRRDGTGDTPSDAEIDALEFVVDAGGIANGWDKDILRQWLMRLRPEFYSAEDIKEGESDRLQPIGSPAKTNPTQPRNGTPVEGSVPGEGTKPVPHQTCPHVRGTVTQHCSLNFTLTNAEREAVEAAAWACGNCNGFGGVPTRPAVYKGNEIAATLRKLLERLHT